MTAEEVIRLLRLEPLEPEGGYFRQTFKSEEASAIYYLLTPETFSAFHRLQMNEVYHFYLGDPVDLIELRSGGPSERTRLGPEIGSGQVVQHVVSAGTWQASRLSKGGAWALLGTTCSPPFDEIGFELGVRARLLAEFPGDRDWIQQLTRD